MKRKLIDKSAIVAEIKGLIRANELYLSESTADEVRFQKTGAYSVLNDLLHFIDTLEVKDVDLELEYENNNSKITAGTKIRSKTNPNVILSIISNNSQFYNSNVKPKKTETVYTCDNCPHAGNLMCCHNCPNF